MSNSTRNNSKQYYISLICNNDDFFLHVPRNLKCEFLNRLLIRTIQIFHIFKAVLHHLNTGPFTLLADFEQDRKN